MRLLSLGDPGYTAVQLLPVLRTDHHGDQRRQTEILLTDINSYNMDAHCFFDIPDAYEKHLMTDEYRIIEEADEHRLLMEEAQMVGENINALLAAIYCILNPSLEELEKHVPYPHLTEYALNVMEGMGLVSRSDLDDLERDGTGTDDFSEDELP